NPHKLASPYEFFIVTQQGGAHHLDGDYTVFGKVIKGMDVVDEISKQPTISRNWPITNIYIKNVELIDKDLYKLGRLILNLTATIRTRITLIPEATKIKSAPTPKPCNIKYTNPPIIQAVA